MTPYKEARDRRSRIYDPSPPWAVEHECERAIPALTSQASFSLFKALKNPKSQEALSYQATASDPSGWRVTSPLAV